MNTLQLRDAIKKHIREDEFQRALVLCKKLFSQQNVKFTFDDSFNKGLCHFKLDQQEEAVYSYDMALSLDSHNVQAMSNKGISLLRLNRTDEAFCVFREALSISPSVGPAWFNIGFYHIALSDKVPGAYEKGVNAFRRAVKANSSFAEARVYLPLLEAYGTVGYLLKFSAAVDDMEDAKVLTASN